MKLPPSLLLQLPKSSGAARLTRTRSGCELSLSTRSRALSFAPIRGSLNRIFPSIRSPDDLVARLAQSGLLRKPLVTLWTATWCAACRAVAPRVQAVVESGAGAEYGGIAYCTIDCDAPAALEMAGVQAVRTIPTLISYDSTGEPQVHTKVVDSAKLANRLFLEDWIAEEARRFQY